MSPAGEGRAVGIAEGEVHALDERSETLRDVMEDDTEAAASTAVSMVVASARRAPKTPGSSLALVMAVRRHILGAGSEARFRARCRSIFVRAHHEPPSDR
jgi:hypothetical protein